MNTNTDRHSLALHAGDTADFHKCGTSTSDGNADDPTYAYCGLSFGHAGDHGEWEV